MKVLLLLFGLILAAPALAADLAPEGVSTSAGELGSIEPATLDALSGAVLDAQGLNLFEGPATTVTQRCCKICRKGKACGNSCISRRYTCHQPPGCACNAE